MTTPTLVGRATRALLAVGLVVGSLAVAAAVVAAPAAAHNVLRSTVPAADSQVDVPPAAVTLEFDQPAIAAGTQVQVTGPDGAVVNEGNVVLANSTVSQPISSDLAAGAYEVLWRATSADGHPISGEFAFTALAAAAPAAPLEPATEPTDAPSAAPGGEPSESSSEAPSEAPPEVAEPTPDDGTTSLETAPAAAEDSGSSTPWVLGGIALVAVLGVVVGLVTSRRRGARSPG